MTYCFVTDIECYRPKETTFDLFDFRRDLCLRPETKKDFDSEVVLWIVKNAPDTKFVVKLVSTTITVRDNSVVFRNIHPDIDGLTNDEALNKIKTDHSMLRFGVQMLAQLNTGEKHVMRKRWCALLMSDNDAVHFKLRFPTIHTLKD